MAEDQDQSQKTEEPTPRKLEQARRKGQVVSSQEVKHLFILMGVLLLVMVFAPFAMARMTAGMGAFLTILHTVPVEGAPLRDFLTEAAAEILLVLALPLVLLVALAIAATLVQHGLVLSGEQLKPKLEKLSLIKGLQRQFSARALVEFVKGLAKIAIVGTVAALIILPEIAGFEQLAGLATGPMMERVWVLATRMLIAVVAVMAVIAGLDYMFQRYEFYKQQRMTKQEIKDEYKQTEGDPMVKARLRQIRLERSRRRMMASVPEADVVITNPTHFAVAMKYDPASMAAPRLVAKGVDVLARRIREVAEASGVMVVENPPLARALYAAVELDGEIPPEHYKAVAEVISYVFKLQRRPMPAA